MAETQPAPNSREENVPLLRKDDASSPGDAGAATEGGTPSGDVKPLSLETPPHSTPSVRTEQPKYTYGAWPGALRHGAPGVGFHLRRQHPPPPLLCADPPSLVCADEYSRTPVFPEPLIGLPLWEPSEMPRLGHVLLGFEVARKVSPAGYVTGQAQRRSRLGVHFRVPILIPY